MKNSYENKKEPRAFPFDASHAQAHIAPLAFPDVWKFHVWEYTL